MKNKLVLLISILGIFTVNASAHNPGGAFISIVIIPSLISLILSLVFILAFLRKRMNIKNKFKKTVLLLFAFIIIFLALSAIISYTLGVILYINFFE